VCVQRATWQCDRESSRNAARAQELEEEAKRADRSAFDDAPSDGEQRKRKGGAKGKAPPPPAKKGKR
jgi:hypothetical protein